VPATSTDQLALFAERDAVAAVEPVAPSAETSRLAAAMPPGFRLGTSSWAFPGWQGQVWARDHTEVALARHGLPAYAAHPLLNTVSIDRSYYAPLTAAQYAAYAEQVPADFRFVVKAPAEITSPMLRGNTAGGAQRENRRFLDPYAAERSLVSPVLTGLGSKLGLVLLQIPPMPAAWVRDPVPFAQRLRALLASLPPSLPHAVELRNPQLLCEPVFDALLLSGSLYCYSVHPQVPDIERQHALLPGELAARGPLVVRWNLRPSETYTGARARFAPCTHLQAEDRVNRPAITALCRRAIAAARPAYIIANNKAEGSAPATLFRLAEEITAAP